MLQLRTQPSKQLNGPYRPAWWFSVCSKAGIGHKPRIFATTRARTHERWAWVCSALEQGEPSKIHNTQPCYDALRRIRGRR